MVKFEPKVVFSFRVDQVRRLESVMFSIWVARLLITSVSALCASKLQLTVSFAYISCAEDLRRYRLVTLQLTLVKHRLFLFIRIF